MSSPLMQQALSSTPCNPIHCPLSSSEAPLPHPNPRAHLTRSLKCLKSPAQQAYPALTPSPPLKLWFASNYKSDQEHLWPPKKIIPQPGRRNLRSCLPTFLASPPTTRFLQFPRPSTCCLICLPNDCSLIWLPLKATSPFSHEVFLTPSGGLGSSFSKWLISALSHFTVII